MEDKRLIHRCKHGDREAFCRIYAKYSGLLFKLAVSVVRESHTAEDIVKDVIVSFAEKIGAFHLTGSLKAYLSVCAVNRAKNQLRHCRNHDCPLESQPDTAGPAAEPDSRIVLNEQMQAIAEAMEQLPVEQRQIIALRHYAQMKIRRIAQSLELPENTVKSRYRYGMDKLRHILNDREVIK